MSYASNKLLFPYSRKGRLVFFFSIFWFLSGSFLFLHTLILKNHIQEQQIQTAERALRTYFEHNGGVSGTHLSLQNDLPYQLDFIRLVSGKDQLLITGNSRMDFSGLVELNPLEQGAWIDLKRPKKQGNWLLVSQTLANGSIAQAGKNDSGSGLAIYKKSVTDAYWFFILSGVIALGLAFLSASLIRYPLRQLESDIEKGLKQKSLLFQESREQLDDLAPLYHLLEQIFFQNRQLIQEIQSSLDNVAHDLRTPMTRLRAVAEYALQSDRNEPQLYRSALSDCLEESERVLSMLKVMMSVAEAEAGTMRLELQEIDVLKTLEDVVGLYQYVAEEEQITVSCTGESGVLVQADKTRISQVWANLLDNGIKYGHESGNVTITAERDNGEAVIRFYDDGMGISETEINRIWDRLYRGDRSRTKQGLGLGLNFVKAVIEAHGGRVLVTSSLQEGSCFDVRLPLHHGATQKS
ncbi:MAG: HAMP domain-containing histidine kinase [Desulfocapsa sp.]|nr:HAMP domain-containing histidine kinase [Desulfocapsa sp.]